MRIRNPLILKEVDRWASSLGVVAGRVAAALFAERDPDPRPLIVRPGGMGDLILLCIACEEAGLPPQRMLWIIESRSEVWARHLQLDYLCYDAALLGTLWKIAGRFRIVVNAEQRYGLSQAAALAARARQGSLAAFDTNLQSASADSIVYYDPRHSHEVTEFSRLLSAAFGTAEELRPRRRRRQPAAGIRMVGLSGLQSPQRAFTLDQWTGFVRNWAGTERFEIAGAPADREFAAALAARFGPSQASIYEGGFSDLCGRIAASAEVLTVDGGFEHMASYYGVPVVAVFTSSRDGKWAPLGEGSAVVRRRDLACQPCAMFAQVPRCDHRFACKEVSLEERLVTLV